MSGFQDQLSCRALDKAEQRGKIFEGSGYLLALPFGLLKEQHEATHKPETFPNIQLP